MESSEEAERFVGWACKVILMDINKEVCLKIKALNMERYEERISLKEGSSFKPLRQVRSFT